VSVAGSGVGGFWQQVFGTEDWAHVGPGGGKQFEEVLALVDHGVLFPVLGAIVGCHFEG